MINSLKLQNFRNYRLEIFEFDPSINIIVGPNGVGKTNLLEAILFLCQGTSYRAKDIDLINYNNETFQIEIEIGNQSRSARLSRNNLNSKQFIINTKNLKLLTKNNRLPVILFEPNDLVLLNESKENRRKFLDTTIAQTTTGYSKILNQYQRTLTQRNKLLKMNAVAEQLFPWNIKLSQLAGQIIKFRLQLIDDINKNIEQIYTTISGKKTTLKLNYLSLIPTNNYETNLLQELENNFHLDKLKGHTSLGTHRDDFELILNNHQANKTASRGETRSLVLALKISQKYIIESTLLKKAIFLLDDVFSELDGQRRKFLLKELKNNQTFITTTDADMIINHLDGKYKIIPISRN